MHEGQLRLFASPDPERVRADLAAYGKELKVNGLELDRSAWTKDAYQAWAKTNGRSPLTDVYGVFASWSAACAAVEAPKPGGKRAVGTRAEARASLKRCARELDRGPLREVDYLEWSRGREDVLSLRQIGRLYERSWQAACADAGVEAARYSYPEQQSIYDLLREMDDEGKLTRRRYDDDRPATAPSSRAIIRHEGGWNAAKRSAGLAPVGS